MAAAGLLIRRPQVRVLPGVPPKPLLDAGVFHTHESIRPLKRTGLLLYCYSLCKTPAQAFVFFGFSSPSALPI